MKHAFIIGLFILCLLACKEQVEPTERASSKTKNTPISAEIETTKSDIPQANKLDQLSSLVPPGFFILDSAFGNKNEKGEEHIALVLASINEKNQDMANGYNRKLLLVKRKNGILQEEASNDEIVLCKTCGGVFGDPYNGIELNNNILKVYNYGGSAWRWSEHYTFRFQNEKWELIGASFLHYWTNAPCNENQDVTAGAGHLEDINFSTQKMNIIRTKDEACEPYENYWKSFEKKKPISLNGFPGLPNQWPNGKIKDGDGK